MSDDTRERGCPQYADDLAELALGVLTGRDRARALSHVESCRRCADELEQLSRVADTVVQAAPEVEPPVGFEVRLFERMGVATVDPKPHRRFRASRLVPLGVAAAVVALGLGLGLTLTSSPAPTTTRSSRTTAEVSADLVAERRGGRPGRRLRRRQALDVDDAGRFAGPGDGHVRRDHQGRRHPLGRVLRRPQGLRGVGRPAARRARRTIRTAEVVSPSGTVIATATLG